MEKNYGNSNQIFSICCWLTLENFPFSLDELSVTLPCASLQLCVEPAQLTVVPCITLLGPGTYLLGIVAPKLGTQVEL